MNEGTLAKPQSGVAKMQEVSGNTGQVGGSNQTLRGGVYRHPASGEEIIALDDPITGDAQARGYVRAGFEWVRDVKDGEVKSVGIPSQDFSNQPARKLETSADDLKGIQARLNALEAENAKLREASNSSPATVTELSQEQAKKAAEEKTGERLSGSEVGGVNATTEPTKEKKKSTSTKKEGK